MDVVVNLEVRQRIRKGENENYIVGIIKDCGFDYKLNGMEFENFTYDDLMLALGV